MALKLTPDGKFSDMGFYPDASLINEAIGGYLELIQIPDGFEKDGKTYNYMYGNEDGRRLGLTVNSTASQLSKHHFVLGTVVLMDEDDQKKDMEG